MLTTSSVKKEFIIKQVTLMLYERGRNDSKTLSKEIRQLEHDGLSHSSACKIVYAANEAFQELISDRVDALLGSMKHRIARTLKQQRATS